MTHNYIYPPDPQGSARHYQEAPTEGWGESAATVGRGFRTVLEVVMRVVVIVTCVVILYTIWRGYVALDALKNSLQDLGNNLTGIGG